MQIIRMQCSDPTGRGGKPHHHWSLHGKRFVASWSLWWDYDRVNFGTPIEIHISTEAKHYLIRPFSKAQGYDWANDRYLSWENKKSYRHIVVSPQRPEAWKRLHG